MAASRAARWILHMANNPTVCICGHSFGTPEPFDWDNPKLGWDIIDAKRAHFEERHPRLFAQGGCF